MKFKAIIKETNYHVENSTCSQRVNIQVAMDMLPKEVQKEIENDFNVLFEKIVSLVPNTIPKQGLPLM